MKKTDYDKWVVMQKTTKAEQWSKLLNRFLRKEEVLWRTKKRI